MIERPLEVEVSLDRDDYFFRVLKDKDAKKAINGTKLDASYFNLGETYEVWKLLKSGEAIYFWGGCKGISATSYMEREGWEEVVLFEVIGEPQRGKENESEETEVKKDLKEAILGIEVTQFDGQKADLEELVNPKQLENVISDWMPEVLSQELPAIPQFVADWIEEVKPDNSLRVAFEYIAQRKRDNHDDELAFLGRGRQFGDFRQSMARRLYSGRT